MEYNHIRLINENQPNQERRNRMKQLRLDKKDLVEMGFKLKVCEGKAFADNRAHYVLETLNGYFYYNPKETVYVWYHRTVL